MAENRLVCFAKRVFVVCSSRSVDSDEKDRYSSKFVASFDHRNVPTAVGLFRLGFGSRLSGYNDATASSGTSGAKCMRPGDGCLAEGLHCLEGDDLLNQCMLISKMYEYSPMHYL